MMIRHSPFYRIHTIAMACLMAFGFLLASCGGGRVSGEGDSSSDEETSATPSVVNLPPVAVISISPASAVPNQTMTLDGSASSDPEAAPIKSYAWQQDGGQAVTLSDAQAAQATFTVPDVNTTLIFELIVTDDKDAASTPATVEIPVTTTVTPLQQNAVFVSSTIGDDAPTRSGSHTEPVKTIGRALSIANEKGLADIYVMEGTYKEMVIPNSGIFIKGCVTAVDADGNPLFAADNSKTILTTPVGTAQAIRIKSVNDVRVDCMSIIGASKAGSSLGVSVDDALTISLNNLSIKTLGTTGASCRDIQVIDSSNVTITDSNFTNSGKCSSSIGVLADNVQNFKIIPESDTNTFTVASGGSEDYLKSIQVQNSADIKISGVTIENDQGTLAANTVFTGITMEDAEEVTVSDNSINVDGGDRPLGIYFRCSDVANDAKVQGNEISFSSFGTSATGVRIHCTQTDGDFEIRENRIELLTPDGQAVSLRGVQASSLLKSMKLKLLNNAITMPVAANDLASKIGIYLSKLGAGSAVSSIHNTMLIVGGSGELHALWSNRTNVQFSFINNTLLIYGGGNTNNAVFLLPSGCDNTYCAKDIVANLINVNVGSKKLPLFYYPDKAQFVVLDTANECDLNPNLAQCKSQQVDHGSNVLKKNLKPTYFDFSTAWLKTPYQVFAKDLGETGTGVTLDIEEKARADGKPDIGAVEY